MGAYVGRFFDSEISFTFLWLKFCYRHNVFLFCFFIVLKCWFLSTGCFTFFSAFCMFESMYLHGIGLGKQNKSGLLKN